jgi:signal transduction histidine kinase
VIAVRDFAPLVRLERTLIWIRWLGTAFALFQMTQLGLLPPEPPDYAWPIGYGIVGAVAVGNLAVMAGVARARETAAIRRIGIAAFALDTAVLFAFVWLFSYDRHDTTWALLYILPLEGAIRYEMRGAVAAFGVAAVFELGREIYRVIQFDDYPFVLGAWTFRVGIDGLIAFAAGFMARSWQRAAAKAERRATEAEELAMRETAARRELAAFHATLLAGVAESDLEPALQSMVDEVARHLGLETLAIGVVEGDALRFPAVYGLPAATREQRVQRGEGVTGTAWAQGRPILVEDVREFPGYVEVDARVRCELAVPLRIGDEIVGVLDVESRDPHGLTPATLDLMTRLADQMAIVMNNARALTRQREALERLQELDEMKSDFVAITSHELRTPLTAIRGFIDTLRSHHDRFTPEEQRHFLDIIDAQGRKLTRILEDLLAVSRLEAGQMRVVPEDVEITALLDDLSASFESQAERIRLHMNANGHAHIDPHRTSQVLRNLVQNALKFSPPGTPVEVAVDRQDGLVEFTVSDRGMGIPAEELDRVFDRFHQVRQAVDPIEEGAGLGLYISKRLVEAMGGTISVRSSPGDGSTFRVSLPAVAGAIPSGPAPPPGSAPSD